MHISDEQLRTIRQTIGEAFVSNELFHNWGNVDERKNDVIIRMWFCSSGAPWSRRYDRTVFLGL